MNADEMDRAISEHFARIHRAALALCGNPWDADDLAQETFLVFARQQSSFEGRSRLYTWLYGILLNLFRRLNRQQGMARRKLKVVWDEGIARATTVPPAETSLEVREWKSGLWSRVAMLPEAQRDVLVLRYSAGLRYEEIAEVLQCPLGTVKSRMFHALLALRVKLEEDWTQSAEPPAFPGEDLHHAI